MWEISQGGGVIKKKKPVAYEIIMNSSREEIYGKLINIFVKRLSKDDEK